MTRPVPQRMVYTWPVFSPRTPASLGGKLRGRRTDRIRKSVRFDRTCAVVLATIAAFALLFYSGCSRIVADHVLHFGSNRGGTPFPKDLPGSWLQAFAKGHYLEVQDDPLVHLMIWVVEPRQFHAEIWYGEKDAPSVPEEWAVEATLHACGNVAASEFYPGSPATTITYLLRWFTKESTPPIMPIGTIIFLNGQGGCARTASPMWPGVAYLANAGYRVVMVDLRSQGDSTGEELGFVIKDARDISKVLDWLERKQLLTEPVGIMGHSYGSASGGLAAVNDPRIRTAILSGTPMAWRSVLEFQLPQESFVWRIMSEEARERTFQIINERMGDEAYNLDARTFIATTTKPVLLLHGRLDDNVPVEHAIEIHRARPEGTRLVIFEDCDHSSHFWTHFDEVRALCLSWFAEHMKEKEAVASQVGEFDVEND